MTERASKHARRRSAPAAELEQLARARVRQLGSPPGPGWVPTEPTPVAPRQRVTAAARPAVAGAVRDRLPLAVRGVVVEPRARALAGIAGVLVLGLLLGLLLIWRARPASEPVPPVRRSGPPASTAGSPAASPSAASALVVHVAGAVRRPGLVELRPGARVADAVAAAGGPARNAELASVNLARPVVDGEQLVVLARGEGPAAAAPPPVGGIAASGAPINLNTATLEQLDTLPGVGPVLAQRILDWRSEHGRFGSTDELREVSGIGEATFADIKPLVRV